MRTHFFLSILGLCVSLTQAHPLNSVATPADVEHVLTPGGLRPKSQVHAIPAGSLIKRTDNATIVLDAAGKVLHSFPLTNATGPSVGPSQNNGWVAYASWVDNTGSPITSFSTDWAVPQPPPSVHGQTLFLFNSLVPVQSGAIVQPVLQFGPSAAGGGNSWNVASWYVGEQTLHTNLVAVSPGQKLAGLITSAPQSGDTFNYVSSFTNVAGTTLNLQNYPEFPWATETLEVYSTTSAADFPFGVTIMGNINIRTQASSTPPVAWTTINDPADNITAVVVVDGPVNGRVDIHYPH